ncbi:MAG: HD domain-containing phosphohydrolase [Thermoguttaceae bacterium]
MLRVPLSEIRPGMILARPIPLPHDPYRYLLQRDVEIPMDVIPRLKRLGILDVWVRNRDFEFLEDLVDEGLSDCQREIYHHVRRNFHSMLRDARVEVDLRHFQSSISELFNFLKSSLGSGILLQKLDAFDNYLVSHSANVCYLALLLGMKLERYLIEQRQHKTAREAKELHLLGLGCLLHDVGKMRVAREILDKPGKLTPEEMAEMRRHTTYGYEMVHNGVPASAAQVVLNHHQRYSGGGYPARIDAASGQELPPPVGRQIPVFSRIAIIADVYDAATTQRCYSPAKLPVQALHEMRTSCRGFFDPVVAEAFYRVVPPFPIGQVVTLSNGIEAVVVDFSPQYPVRPKVQCLRTAAGERFANPSLEEIDLALDSDLSVVAVAGQNVRPWMACQESPLLEPALA